MAQIVQFGFVEEQAFDTNTCHRLAHVVYVAAGEREHRVGLRQTHLVGQVQQVRNALIIRLHLHRLHALAS